MATVITSECINCGACEPECPNTAIYAGGVDWELGGAKHPALAADIFYIVPDKCTECVGFFDREACAVVCPVDCCIPDPQRPETEDALLARARQLHPERTFPAEFPSRFRTAGETAPAPPAAATPPPKAPEVPVQPKPPAAEPAAVTSAPAPQAPATPTPAAPVIAAHAEPAPVPKPEPKPAAQAPVQAKPPPPAPRKDSPAAEQVAKPAQPAAAEPEQGPVPPLETFEIPIDCFRCGHQYTVPFKHVRTGVVHFCPACHGSFVVTRSLHGHIDTAARRVYAELCREAEVSKARSAEARQALAERVRGRLDAFVDELRESAKQFRPPGAPRKRAGIFG
jgi:ferredoxin